MTTLTLLQVLVVDADLQSADRTAGIVSQAGHIVDLVHTGTAALEAIEKIDYDLILTDCTLPDISGFRIAEEITKQEAPEKRVPVMALTTSQSPDDIRLAYRVGMCNYILKPFSMPKFLAALSLLSYRKERAHEDNLVQYKQA